MNKTHTTRLATTRRGSIYVAVMGVAMIVSIIGMVSMSIARLQLKSTRNLQDLAEARLLSQSGVEFGLANMESLSDWRTDRTSGVEMTPLNMGSGTMTYSLVDSDGDLSDSVTDRVRIQGIGRVGEAVYVTSVLLEPGGNGLTSLETSLHSGVNLVLGSNAVITTDQAVSSNSNIDATSSGTSISGDAWAVGTVTGTVSGIVAPTQSPPKGMPDPATVYDYYVTNGTTIVASDIPGLNIDRQLISPASNPFGSTTNPLGIYVIDCQGGDITIKDSRILGTLVLLNAGGGSKIDKDIHWEPAVANYPALMVQGDIEMKWHAEHNLREAQLSVNFNPAGSPYQGSEDTDIVDEYPPLIKGLVYVTGNLTITGETILQGSAVVGGTTTVENILTLTYDSTFLDNPPPGFSAGGVVQIVPGTWTRIPY